MKLENKVTSPAQCSPLALLKALTPLARTLVHDDNARALTFIAEQLPNCSIKGYASGTTVWTWQIPHAWRLLASKLYDADTNEILWDGLSHPLATVNYSLPFEGEVDAETLSQHLFSQPARPDAIPFVYRFYDRDWGFCVPAVLREKILSRNRFKVCIQTEEKPGELLVGECVLKGACSEEILIVSNICHPGIANDSLTGAVAAVDLARYLAEQPNLKYTYRFLFLPETIGSVAYLAHHPDVIERAVGGFFSEMLGNENTHCLQLSRRGDTYWDTVAQNALKDFGVPFRTAAFLTSAANDEKVLDAPGVNIPTISLTRYPYPEYHTSDDNAAFISAERLTESCAFIRFLFNRIERDYKPVYIQKGPVCLSLHDLYPNWYKHPELKQKWEGFLHVMYALDRDLSCEELADVLSLPVETVLYWTDAFAEKGFLEKRLFIIKK